MTSLGPLFLLGAAPSPRAGLADGNIRCEGFRKTVIEDAVAAKAPSVAAVLVEQSNATCRVLWSADGTPLPENRLYGAGSVTKQLTAAGLLSALRARGMDADATAGSIDPRLKPDIRNLTVRQILGQTSGLRDEPGVAGSADPAALERLALSLDETDLVAPAGLAFSYSNLGYALAGHLLARLDRHQYAIALKRRVLSPLGMPNATFEPTAAPKAPRNAALAPAGFLWMSSRDAERLLRAHLSGSRQGVPAVLRQMRTPVVAIPTGALPEGRYGMGLFVTGSGPLARLEHAGTLPGHTAEMVVDPKGRGYAIMTDTEGVRFRITRRWFDGATAPSPAPVLRASGGSANDENLLGRYVGNRFSTEIRRDGDRLMLVSTLFGSQPRELRPTSDPAVWQLLGPAGAPFQNVVVHRRGTDVWLQQALWLVRRQTPPIASKNGAAPTS